MRTLSQMELQSISGGDLDKPLLQSSFSDVATFYGIFSGFTYGLTQGAELFSYTVRGFDVGKLLSQSVGGAAGAAVGGLLASVATHYVIPAATSLIGD